MEPSEEKQHRTLLQRIARQAMLDRGLDPDFSPRALAELGGLAALPPVGAANVRDLRHLAWCSIDNDDSRDLDQLSVAELLPEGNAKVLVAVADVDALVSPGSAIDDHARRNTTSVYTAARTFPMLPEKLSTDLTSLNFASDRPALVVEMVVGDGVMVRSDVYEAMVRNKAKLAYHGVSDWLDGSGPEPESVSAVAGLAENIRLQDRVARQLRTLRHENGALTLETVEPRMVFDDGSLRDMDAERKDRAKELIEDLMIAANGVTARFLASKVRSSLRRVVRTPRRWDRIRELAADHGVRLPEAPDARALEAFLSRAREADPLRFPDLSLSVIKLLGSGEYVVEAPGGEQEGHFGLAVRDYSHSTAPNRRYPDLITLRLLKAALRDAKPPYGDGELSVLAQHCTEKEDAARKVE